jgi:hypothetical protein
LSVEFARDEERTCVLPAVARYPRVYMGTKGLASDREPGNVVARIKLVQIWPITQDKKPLPPRNDARL